MEDAIIQREKAANKTDVAVEGEGSVPKPFRPDEFVISLPPKEITDTPMTPEGREAPRSADEEGHGGVRRTHGSRQVSG